MKKYWQTVVSCISADSKTSAGGGGGAENGYYERGDEEKLIYPRLI
jgi:hypothetical protein